MPSLSWNASWIVLHGNCIWIVARYAHGILFSLLSFPGMWGWSIRMAARQNMIVAITRLVLISSKLCWITITFLRCRRRPANRVDTLGSGAAIMLKVHRLV